MKSTWRLAASTFVLGMMSLMASCIVAPREGYYDRDHHRYYHENGWHDCGERDDHCR